MTVVIPTLAADAALAECLRSLDAQTYQDFEVIVVDNSGKNLVRKLAASNARLRIIENSTNEGFGGAINQGWHASEAPLIATINDDATACPDWLTQLVATVEKSDDVGLVASQVRLDESHLDSAGMLLCADGSSKQRGHGSAPAEYNRLEDILLPSGSAALYRRKMLDQVGGFDASFFLYCEDTDLGLRARRAGWRCLYQPKAVVHHRYSHSAGRVSALKAYLVERNRLRVLVKNFPARLLWRAPFATVARYWWHLRLMLSGQGAAGDFHREGTGLWLVWFVVKAHAALLASLPQLLRQRREIQRTSAVPTAHFVRLIEQHSITPKEVAEL